MTRYLEHMDIEQISEAVRNPKAHDLETLAKAIERWGFADAPVMDERTVRLVAGHGRLTVLRQWKEAGGLPPDGVEVDVNGKWLVPVQRGWSSNDDREAEAFLLAHNRLVEAGGWHTDMLGAVLKDMQAHYEPLGGLATLPMGFSESFLSQILAVPPAPGEDPGPQAPPAEPVSKTGELYQLGPHRLLCGDSTKPEDVQLLMGTERAILCATDPPYLVDYDGTNHPGKVPGVGKSKAWDTTVQKWKGVGDTTNKKWDDYHEHDEDSDLYVKFLDVAIKHALDVNRKPGVAFYQWHASRRQRLVEDAWDAHGILIHQQIIWVKSRPILTRSHFMWQHEPCFYGWISGKTPKKPESCGENSTVWTIGKAGEENGIHPTQKPLEIFGRPIRYHMEPGEIAYEPFCGSGSQLIAAALEGRRCFAIEMSPAFCDAIRIRWTMFAKSAGVDPGPGALEPKEGA